MSNLDHGKRQTEKDDINHPITLLHRSLICNCHALTAAYVCTSSWRRSIDSMLTDENLSWRYPDAWQICVSGGEQSRSSSHFISLCPTRRRSIVFIRRERFVQKYQQFIKSRIYALTASQQECAAKWSSNFNFSQSGNWRTSWQRSVSAVDGWNWREFAMNVRFALLDRKRPSRRAFANDLLSKEKLRWERFNTFWTFLPHLNHYPTRTKERMNLHAATIDALILKSILMNWCRKTMARLPLFTFVARIVVSCSTRSNHRRCTRVTRRDRSKGHLNISSWLPMIISSDTSTCRTMVLSLRWGGGYLTSSRWIRLVSTRSERVKVFQWSLESY